MVDPKHIGTQFPPFSFVVERDDVRAFAEAIGDPNPAYVAQDDGFAIPPTFPTAFMLKGAGDMLWQELESIGVELLLMLHSEQEYEYLAPIHLGDSVMGQTALADVYTRESGLGSMEFLEFVTEYHNQHDEQVLKERSLIIVRGEEE